MNAGQRKEGARLTRDELYALVWETPMARLAVQFGISGNGLSKICDRMNIPVPPRGYWAKKAAGKAVLTHRLPEEATGTHREVTITPTPRPEPVPIETQELIEKVRSKMTKVVVPNRLTRPHHIIAKWLAAHREPVENSRRFNWGGAPQLTATERRRHRILHALFRALERQGAEVEERDQKTLVAKVMGEPVEFQVRQKSRRVRRVPSSQEEKTGWQVKTGLVTELHQTERLVFSFKAWLPAGFPRDYAETDLRPLEGLLPDIVAAFIAMAPSLVERRRQWEEEARLRRIEEARRYELEQEARRDRNCWRRFLEMAETRRCAAIASELIEALKSKPVDVDVRIGERSMGEWLSWAEANVKAMDPDQHGASAVFQAVSDVNEWTYRD